MLTREEAKRRAELYSALAKGKSVQVQGIDGSWVDVDINKLNYFIEIPIFRIKPEPKYRPFKTQEECWNEMHKHPNFGWVKNDIGNIFKIIVIFNDSIRLNECNSSYSELFKTFKFTDGTPFGIKEE